MSLLTCGLVMLGFCVGWYIGWQMGYTAKARWEKSMEHGND